MLSLGDKMTIAIAAMLIGVLALEATMLGTMYQHTFMTSPSNPAGAATGANQLTGISAINTMSAKLPPSLGAQAAGSSLSVVETPAQAFQDAFSRARVSTPFVLFDSTTVYGLNTNLWETLAGGTGTSSFTPGQSALVISTGGTASSASFVRQTSYYTIYQPGRSQLVYMTFAMGTARTNSESNVGYYDASDGIFFQRATDSAGTSTLYVAQRSSVSGSVVTTKVAQSAWNLDPLDGTGSSGVTLDISKAQILVIDLQWLGVGRVRIGFDIDGVLYYVHQFLNANSETGVYMSSATLPGRYEVRNTGTSSGILTMQSICAGILSEGGELTSTVNQFSTQSESVTVADGTFTPMISLRLRDLIFTSNQRNHCQMYLRSVQVENDDSATGLVYSIFVNPTTLTGASFSNYDSSLSIVQVDTSATAVAGGTSIASGLTPASLLGVGATSELPFDRLRPFVYHALNDEADVVTIAAKGNGGAVSAIAAINWIEICA